MSADLRIGSLCSGYGGLDLGLMAVVGGAVAWHVENDPNPAAVLDANFPGVPNYGDVTTTDWTQVEPVDWLTAGYPCQPFSHAGKRKGSADERHLWPFVADAIGVLRPRRVLLENVAGHVSLGLDAVLWDLAALGYDTTWGVVRAADAGAPHGRARIFIVAADASGERHALKPGIDGGQPAVVSALVGAGARDSSGHSAEGVPVLERGAGPVAAAADTGGEAVRLGTGLRQGDQGWIGRGRSDDHGSPVVPDPASDGRDEGRTESAGQLGRSDASERGDDAPADAYGAGRSGVTELHGGAPSGVDGERRGHVDGCDDGPGWGPYESTIRRWELVIGRSAPRPTERGARGQQRLSPRFVEWMMGLPDGWVTGVLPRNPALKALGNGVVPQQATLAVETLLSVEAKVA